MFNVVQKYGKIATLLLIYAKSSSKTFSLPFEMESLKYGNAILF